jgi:hypothetical protein
VFAKGLLKDRTL